MGHRRTLTSQRAAAATARVPRTSQGRAEWSVLHSAVAASGDVIAVAGDGRKDASPNLGSHSAGFYRLAARDLFPLQSMVIASPGATQRVACNVVSECTQAAGIIASWRSAGRSDNTRRRRAHAPATSCQATTARGEGNAVAPIHPSSVVSVRVAAAHVQPLHAWTSNARGACRR